MEHECKYRIEKEKSKVATNDFVSFLAPYRCKLSDDGPCLENKCPLLAIEVLQNITNKDLALKIEELKNYLKNRALEIAQASSGVFDSMYVMKAGQDLEIKTLDLERKIKYLVLLRQLSRS